MFSDVNKIKKAVQGNTKVVSELKVTVQALEMEREQSEKRIEQLLSDYNTTFSLLENLKREHLSNSMQISGMTFSNTFRNISGLTVAGVKSEPQYMRGLQWQIWVKQDIPGKYLGIFLLCSPYVPSDGWTCTCKRKTILSANSVAGYSVSKEGMYRTYSSKSSSWGFCEYVDWTELVKKHVKDDSITVIMEIKTEQPHAILDFEQNARQIFSSYSSPQYDKEVSITI